MFSQQYAENYFCNFPPKNIFCKVSGWEQNSFELSSISILSKYLLLGSVWRDGTCKPSTFWHPPRLLGQVPVRLYSCTIASSLTNTCSSVLLYYITSLTLSWLVPLYPPAHSHRVTDWSQLGLLLERKAPWGPALSHSCGLGAWLVGWPPKCI